MLQCFYARAMHSRNPKNKFRDTKAEELIDRIDYDFSNAKKDTAMSGGIVYSILYCSKGASQHGKTDSGTDYGGSSP